LRSKLKEKRSSHRLRGSEKEEGWELEGVRGSWRELEGIGGSRR